MVKRLIHLACCLLVSLSWAQAQSKIDVLEHFSFISPVKHNYKLSGNFCELRGSHFHGGLDIKQSGTGKDTIFSIGDGYISRILVSRTGYGQAIYIDHPSSGLTSVYAHLDKFNDILTAYVEQHQMQEESYDVDILVEPGELPVNQRDFIGMMGNTGFSLGKHLHFEIRETATERAINPFLVGFDVHDNIPPSLLGLSIHGLDDNVYKIWERSISLHKYQGQEIELFETINVPSKQVGLAIHAFDRTNGSHNKQGIYAIKLYVNDTLHYNSRMDKLAFDQAKYLKGFVDYSARLQNKGTYALCYRYPGNDLSLIQYSQDGIIVTSQDTATTVLLVVEDFAGNARKIKLRLRHNGELLTPKKESQNATPVSINTHTTVELHGLKVYFEPKTLYRNIQCKVDTVRHAKYGTKYKIHDYKEPFKHPLKITIKPDFEIPEQKKSKVIVIKEDGGITNCGGAWQDSLFETRITGFGTYRLGYDTVPPSIKTVSFLAKASKLKRFLFRITDNFPVIKNGFTDPIRIKVWIDGQFHISPFDLKTQTLMIPIHEIDSGKHELVIEVKDYSDNTSYFNVQFSK